MDKNFTVRIAKNFVLEIPNDNNLFLITQGTTLSEGVVIDALMASYKMVIQNKERAQGKEWRLPSNDEALALAFSEFLQFGQNKTLKTMYEMGERMLPYADVDCPMIFDYSYL